MNGYLVFSKCYWENRSMKRTKEYPFMTTFLSWIHALAYLHNFFLPIHRKNKQTKTNLDKYISSHLDHFNSFKFSILAASNKRKFIK